MTVNAINGSLLSAFSAVDGVTLSTLSAINGQSLEPAGSPSGSEIIITGNAEIENDGGDLFTFSGGFASGVAGAHGRVYDNVTFTMGFTYPGGQEEFVSAGCRVLVRTDATATFMTFRVVSGSTDHIGIRRLIGGNFSIRNFASGVNTDSGAANFTEDTWFYVMLYARIHQTLGECTAKLFDASGALVETLTQTTTDTQNGANLAEISTWGNPTNDTYVDSLWTDLTGAFRGAGYVETRQAVSNGDTNSWSRGGTDTGNNWDQIDEAPKTTTSYVFSTGADQVDLYNFQDRAQAGTPVTVQQITYARAHTAGTRQYRPICKIGGTIYEGDIFSVTSTTTDTAQVYNWQNNPATGNAWTDSEIDSAQFGVKSVTTDVRVQAVCLHILVDIAS